MPGKYSIQKSSIGGNESGEYATMLEAMALKNIMTVTATDGGFEITEACDDYWFVWVTPDQLQALGKELIALSQSK